MDSKKENLRELIEKFMDPKNARMYLEDIEAGERILREHPAPRPDDMLLANIKANMSLHKLPQRTVTFKKRVYEAIAVAASIIIIAAISLRSFYETPPYVGEIEQASLLPTGWWTDQDAGHTEVINNFENINSQLEQMDIDTGDNDAFVFDEFENQIKQLENRLYDIENSQGNYISTSIIEDLENRINKINSGSFWQDDYSNTDAFEI